MEPKDIEPRFPGDTFLNALTDAFVTAQRKDTDRAVYRVRCTVAPHTQPDPGWEPFGATDGTHVWWRTRSD